MSSRDVKNLSYKVFHADTVAALPPIYRQTAYLMAEEGIIIILEEDASKRR